jgi:homospermidine synthase
MALLPTIGAETYVESWVPMGKIDGMVIQHGESGSICNFLSDQEYSPTVHYAYKCSPATTEDIEKKGIKSGGDLSIENKILNHSNSDGVDQLGVLFICENLDMYWCGSTVSSEQSKNLLDIKNFGPTASQVLAGILSAVYLCSRKPELGLFGSRDEIDDLKPLMKIAKKWLGTITCTKLKHKAKSTQFSDLVFIKKSKNDNK